jgi:phenylalanyl-tRNA synthetase beta chain
MKVSYKKLQEYFEDKLPTPEDLADAFTFHFAEVESVEKEGEDTILDVKVLPDRASYAKSYEGIALETSAILGLRRKANSINISPKNKTIKVSIAQIVGRLGTDITKTDIVSILNRLDIAVEEKDNELVLSVPENRTDLADWKDIPEEIGRIYGYDKIPAKIPKKSSESTQVQKTFYYAEKIKNLLLEKGFSEIYTYSLTAKGEFHIEKSVASDKNYLRTNLTEGIVKSLDLNAKNGDLLGVDEIKVFEIGKIFPKEGEKTSLCIGIKNLKKKDTKAADKLKLVRDELLAVLEVNATILCTVDDTGGMISLGGKEIGVTNKIEGVLELDLDALIASLAAPNSYSDLNFGKATNVEYKKFSPYPFIVRDIAVFVPEGTDPKELEKMITKHGGELLQKTRLFDVFTKEGKTSYAYRLVLQAPDRTLVEEDATKIMDALYSEVKGKGWMVR